MHVISLGKVTVPSPGTPILLGAILTALSVPDNVLPDRKCHRVEPWPLLANAGVTYVGYSSTARAAKGVQMNKGTGAGVIKQIQIPATTGHQDAVTIEAGADGNSLLVDDFAVDAASASDGLFVFLAVQ